MIPHFKQESWHCKFSGFHSGAVEIFTILRYCAPSFGAVCPSILRPCSGLTLRDEETTQSQTKGNKFLVTKCDVLKERKFQIWHCRTNTNKWIAVHYFANTPLHNRFFILMDNSLIFSIKQIATCVSPCLDSLQTSVLQTNKFIIFQFKYTT